ncbi:MAG: heavy-metal-associated domain-containing protein [Ardenticatenaceae bacterium]
MKKSFVIQNMHCTACAMTIDGVIEELAGVQVANTSFARARTEVTYDPAVTTVEQIVAAIREAGYSAQPA